MKTKEIICTICGGEVEKEVAETENNIETKDVCEKCWSKLQAYETTRNTKE